MRIYNIILNYNIMYVDMKDTFKVDKCLSKLELIRWFPKFI